MADFGPTPSTAEPQPLYARKVHESNQLSNFVPDAGTDYGAGVGNGVPFGAVIVIGSIVAIALVPIPAGVAGALEVIGTFDFPKAASDGGMASGTLAYWDDTAKVATGTSSGNKYLGKVKPPGALTADTIVRIGVDSIANASGSVGFGALPSGTVAAAGSSVSDAAALSAGMNAVTGADGTKGVVLPTTPAAGTIVIVKSVTGGSVLKVYPDAAATVNAISSHAAISMASLTCCIFIATSTTQWYTLPLLPS